MNEKIKSIEPKEIYGKPGYVVAREFELKSLMETVVENRELKKKLKAHIHQPYTSPRGDMCGFWEALYRKQHGS